MFDRQFRKHFYGIRTRKFGIEQTQKLSFAKGYDLHENSHIGVVRRMCMGM
jgi:hypothetical protein